MNIVDIIIPFTVALFIISVGVVLLYQNFQKNLIALELEKAELEARQRDELLQNSIMVQEEERKRIAQDLHDDLGAVISIIKMNLMLMRQKQNENVVADDPAGNVQNLINLSETAMASVRNISHQLMPPQLEAFGLLKSIESVVDQINQLGEIEVHFVFKPDWPFVKWPVALSIYRIIMELFNNTLKHALARNVFLEFDCLNGNLIIKFSDDGTGFPDGLDAGGGLGLVSIDARARAMNGRFDYGNGAEKGIAVILTIPFN